MAVGEIITGFEPAEEKQTVTSGIITDFEPLEEVPTLASRPPEPPPFNYDDFVLNWSKMRSADEDPPQDDVASVFDNFARPWQKLYYSFGEALNRGVFNFATNLGAVMEYANEKLESPLSPKELSRITDAMGELWEKNADYWQAQSAKLGPDWLNEFLGKFAGSLAPGSAEFILFLKTLLLYPAALGAAEAKKAGGDTVNEITGAITKAAEVGVLGVVFKALHPFNAYVKAPILGTTFGVEDAAKQLATTGKLEADQTIEAAATGFGLGITPGGRMGYKDLVDSGKAKLRILDKTIKAEAPKPKVEFEDLQTYQEQRITPSMKPDDSMIVAKVEGKDTGFVWTTKKPEGFEVRKIEVDESMQRKGVGIALMNEAESRWGPYIARPEARTEKGKPFFEAYEKLRQERLAKEQAGQVGVGAPPPAPPTFKFTNPIIEEAYQRSVPKKETLWEKTEGFFTDIWHKMSREYPELPKGKEFAQIQFDLRKLAKQKGVSSYYANLIQSKYLADLKDPADMDLFSRIVVLEDLEVRGERGLDLPWGFDYPTVTLELYKLRAEIANKPNIAKALQEREAARNEMVFQYIEADAALAVDPDAERARLNEQFSNRKYFHHQVLEYINLKGLYGTGKRLKEPLGRGFLRKARGAELDINRDVIQPDYEVLAQMLYDIEINKTLKHVDNIYNIAEKVKKEAKAQELKDWHDAIPDGYVPWQPREGNIFYMADTIPAKLAETLRSGMLEDLDVDSIRIGEALAMGRKRREFVIKKELADTLNDLVQVEKKGIIGKADETLIRGLKSWFLFSPRRYIKYETRNMTGDADWAFIGNPRGFLKSPGATRELGEVLFRKKEISGSLQDFFERGGFDSTLYVQEMGDLKSLWTFERLYSEQAKPAEIPYRVWKRYWKTIRVTNTFRETILRYANYLDYLEQIEKSPEGRPSNFGCSNPKEVMALADKKDRAYMLQNDLMGAYDRISVMGQEIRRHWFLFWSWKELNFKRYVQAMKNTANTSDLAHTVGRKALGSMAKTPFMAYKVGGFLAKATAFWTMLQVWNNTMFPDEEDELAEDVKSRPHIIFGRDSEDRIIYFNRIGALGDFLEWFGLDSAPNDVMKWFKGEKTLKEIATDMVKSPINVIVSGITPQVKVPIEVITGRTLYPDAFKPGTVRDRGLYLARTLGLDDEYKAIMGLPTKGYGESLKRFFIYSSEAGEGAYLDIQDAKRRWLKQQGKGYEGFWLTPKGNALYNIKLALRYEDMEAANKYMYEFYTLGGTAQGLERSIEQMNPLSGLSQGDRTLFLGSLSSDQQKQLEMAMKFYYDILRGKQ